MNSSDLAERIHAVLPQTQCTRCGYPDCRAYAKAIAEGQANINQCPPGGAEGVARLAAITGRTVGALNPENGVESPLRLALIDENWCIGCTLCVQACPVDCIVGAPKLMHTVVGAQCTGCELCLPVCPVDCIDMVDVSSPRTGWAAWSAEQAVQAGERYAFHKERVLREQTESDERLATRAQAELEDPVPATDLTEPHSKRTIINAALARAKQGRGR